MNNVNNKGYYYIEIIISLFIILVFSLPILLTINQNNKNLNSMISNFNLEFISNSLLNESANTILSTKNPLEYLENIEDENIYKFLNITEKEFKSRYENFNYILKIDNYIFKNNRNYNKKTNIKKYNHNEDYVLNLDEIIKITDKNFEIIKTKNYIKIENNSIIINIEKIIDEDINILIDMKNTNWNCFEINANNESERNLNIIINKQKDVEIPKIYYKYSNIKNESNIFLKVLDYNNHSKIFNLYLEIYKDDKLIKKSFKNIILYW